MALTCGECRSDLVYVTVGDEVKCSACGAKTEVNTGRTRFHETEDTEVEVNELVEKSKPKGKK